MPLIEYGCYKCREVSEVLVKDRNNIPDTAKCEYCGSEETTRLISQVNYKVQKKAKYNDDFLGKALPAMRKKKETAEFFAEGKGSDDSKMFELGEQIGGKIDNMIEKNIFRRKK
ncbi:MAG: hypothetical protein FJ320_05975 [SAR202 cluster bacterium]|nr:hypothetical protein [SAR202 cluster bacterium]